MKRKIYGILGSLLAGMFCSAPLAAQQAAPTSAAANLTLPAPTSSLSGETLRNPRAPAWQQFAPRRLALHRTPNLYDTDPPSESVISVVEVRVARTGEKLLVHLSWRDASRDAAELAPAPEAPPEERVLKEQTAATGRFFDAAAVMFPAEGARGGPSPSLQMGDAEHPVSIYYWNAARGALLMDAHGRSTTRRTGENFPAQGIHRNGQWHVTLELPNLPAGVPLAFAVWNGSQQDRDGRKYFSIWHWLE